MSVRVGGVDVFGANAQADHAGGDAAEDWEALQESERKRKARDWNCGGQRGADEAFVSEDLESLSNASGEFAAILDFVEMRINYG